MNSASRYFSKISHQGRQLRLLREVYPVALFGLVIWGWVLFSGEAVSVAEGSFVAFKEVEFGNSDLQETSLACASPYPSLNGGSTSSALNRSFQTGSNLASSSWKVEPVLLQ